MRNILGILAVATFGVPANAALLASDDFTGAADNTALNGYSGSGTGFSGAYAEAGGQAMTIQDPLAWGADPAGLSLAPSVEHTAWNLTRVTRTLSSSVDLTVDGTFYMSFWSEADQNDHAAQIGLSNATSELMAGNGYGGGTRDITAYYGALGSSVSTNGDGTAIEGGWGGEHRQYQVVVTISRSSGNVDVTLDYYRDGYDGTAETTRTVALGAVSDTFTELQIKQDGWNVLDGVRLGTELSDVVIPEPGSMALLSAGLLCMSRRRRH